MAPINNRIVGKTVCIQSRIENVEVVDKEIKAWLGQLGIGSPLADHLELAVHEAVVNAVKHGNNLEVSKQVEVKFGIIDGKMVFEVKDEGAGFNVKNLPDPLAPENIWKESGRGIFFMKKFMEQIEFNKYNNGFQVTLMRKLPNLP